jgi:hypothetical protein
LGLLSLNRGTRVPDGRLDCPFFYPDSGSFTAARTGAGQ